MNAARDDDYHDPPTDDPWFTETAWYSFWTADKTLAAHVYLRFRHNVGIANSCLYVWERGSAVPWEAPYWKHLHVPIPPTLTDAEFLGGLHHQQVEPFQQYRMRYQDGTGYDGAISFDVTFDAVDEPLFLGTKHFDQPGRVTGELMYRGQRHEVDCLALRDRSWYKRSDFALFRSSYSYALADQDNGFLAMCAAPRDQDMLMSDVPVVGGHLQRAGQRTQLVSGMRYVVDRDEQSGHPKRFVIEAKSAAGESFDVTGSVTHVLPLAANPNMLSWMSLVEWEFDGRPTTGEDQEIWSPSLFRAYRRQSVG